MKNDALTCGNAETPNAEETLPKWLGLLRLQVESLQFGTVQVTVHDSKVVQIERIERTRLDRLR